MHAHGATKIVLPKQRQNIVAWCMETIREHQFYLQTRRNAQANSIIFRNSFDRNRIHLDIAAQVYCSAVEHGSEREWNFLWREFKSASDPLQKMNIMESLGCSKQPDLMKVMRKF